MENNWIQLTSIGINIGGLIIAVKLIRMFSRIELKVEMMWGVFMEQYGHRVRKEIV